MSSAPVELFSDGYSFPLDPFQFRALEALARGESVLVSAPTGSGKTVVGEFAVWLALNEGRKAFYTTPLKALSNQKFGDFVALHGASRVGLLTGDNSINPNAPVVVMTTEVLRNMIYERSDLLDDLRYVILDEVHYLQDPYRGAVWEEVIIHLPLDVKIVSLSATVSNADEFAGWVETVRGTTAVVTEESRPVALEHHYLLSRGEMHPMFTADGGDLIPNPRLIAIEGRSFDPRMRSRRGPRGSRGRPLGPRGPRGPDRTDVVEMLAEHEMLPAIYFIFSRKGCDAAVRQSLGSGSRLTTAGDRRRIRDFAEMRCSFLDDRDLDVLGYGDWLEGLVAGFASHHAGLIPVFKEAVEELFKAGLVKVVFATETLSLGINMPARSVVIESVVKFSGERHEVMTAGEFAQLTGRAGRRGIDTLGHAVVLERPDVAFRQVAGLASATLYPLISSFEPSYNMATNLVRNYSREEAEHLLNSSFAQYRADKEVVVLERQIERNDAYLASYREKMACDRGDFEQYWALVRRVSQLERSARQWRQTAGATQTRSALEAARPGQVYVLERGPRRGPVVVVGRERGRRGEPRLVAVTANDRVVRISSSDFKFPPRPVANLRVAAGKGSRPVDADTRRRLAAALTGLDLPGDDQSPDAEHSEVEQARIEVLGHPCHSCPERERHGQWAERAVRLERDTAGMRKRVRSRTETISRKFDRILEVLEEFGYVDSFAPTHKGWVLAHIYNENDLVVAESLSSGYFAGLDPAELASIVSVFVFESRGPFESQGTPPTPATKDVYNKIAKLVRLIEEREIQAGLDLTRGTETGFTQAVYRWCRGEDLERVIDEELGPGDFIRSCKQTIDLLRQLRDTGPDPALDRVLSSAVEQTNRGVVAYTGVV